MDDALDGLLNHLVDRRAVNLEEIAEKWLRQCPACDAGLSMSCVCPPGDPRNVISNLVEEVLWLRIQIATIEIERHRTAG